MSNDLLQGQSDLTMLFLIAQFGRAKIRAEQIKQKSEPMIVIARRMVRLQSCESSASCNANF